jgi:hypothetical protein
MGFRCLCGRFREAPVQCERIANGYGGDSHQRNDDNNNNNDDDDASGKIGNADDCACRVVRASSCCSQGRLETNAPHSDKCLVCDASSVSPDCSNPFSYGDTRLQLFENSADLVEER